MENTYHFWKYRCLLVCQGVIDELMESTLIVASILYQMCSRFQAEAASKVGSTQV